MRSVRSIDALLDLPRDRYVNGFGPREWLVLDIPGAARRDLMPIERALNRYQSRCGCAAAAAGFLAGLGIGVVRIAEAKHSLVSLAVLGEAGIALFIAFALGLLAKFLVLGITRFQFAAACRRCRRQFLASAGKHLPIGEG